MKIVRETDVAHRDYCPAAECRVDFDAMAHRLGAQPERGLFETRSKRSPEYRTVWIALSTGRFASLSQTDMRPSVVELGLEIADDQFFHVEDLEELIAGLGIDVENVKRYRNEFTWIAGDETGHPPRRNPRG